MQKAQYKAGEHTIYLTIAQAMERYQLSRDSIEKYAGQCDAILKIGRNKRYIMSRLDNYFDSFRA